MSITQQNMEGEKDRIISVVQDPFFNFVASKAEKITTAIYLVTNLLSQEEPMRTALRETAITLLSLLHITDTSRENISQVLAQGQLNAHKLAALVATSTYGNLISEMNANILSDEIAKLVHAVTERKDLMDSENRLVLNKGLFNVPEQKQMLRDAVPKTIQAHPPATQTSDHSIGHERHAFSSGLLAEKAVPSPHEERRAATEHTEKFSQRAANLQQKGHQPAFQKSPGRTEDFEHRKRERRELIVKALKKRPDLTVKDIAQTITGCGEKTIQRELVSMVGEGILKKAGERRWTKYSIA